MKLHLPAGILILSSFLAVSRRSAHHKETTAVDPLQTLIRSLGSLLTLG